MKRLASASGIGVFFTSAVALACMHFPPNYVVKEGVKHAFLFHDEKNAHLVINTDLETDQPSLPERLAWVLPFPSLPSKYEEVDPAIFTDLGNLVYPVYKGEGSKGGALRALPSAANAIHVHRAEVVGHYTIHPIEILSTDDGGKALSEWLAKNNFNPMPAEKQKPYLKKGAVFLAVEMNLKGRTKADLKPLHVIYSAENLEFPLRFTHDGRTFDIDLFVYTPWNIFTPHRKNPTWIPKDYLSLVAQRVYKPQEFEGTQSFKNLRALLGNKVGYLYRFEGRGLNEGAKLLSKLERDPFFVPQ